ncbi:MAG: hypothetical protein ACD_87C00136G0010 [uncultured bacterium]|nr:MAG: hypothetical protein ACD_87C00136G0010 [uncultured bacterium]
MGVPVSEEREGEFTMGNLTDDMTRLRGEVDALRSNRGALMQDLARGAKDLTSTVSAMQAGFAAAHAAMARTTGKARASYVARIKKQVGRMRKENAADLAGASQAWFGKVK